MCAILVLMQGVDVFCERCGTPQPKPDATGQRSAGILARRVLDAVGITENQPTPTEDWLRLCLSCRGYSCPTCWNDAESVCQTCAPLPEPVVAAVPEPAPGPVAPDLPPAFLAPGIPEPAFYPPLPEPAYITLPEPEAVALAEPEPEPEPVDVLDHEPVFVAEVEPEAEPVVVAEPEPEPVFVAEPEPEQPVEKPIPPRMPVLPLPPPRPANPLAIPLPPLPAYPVAPQIAFNAHVSVAASSRTSAPAYEAHLLLAPPPELPAHAIAAGLRPCPNCRLTLSARAHFCRRCGAAQAH